MRQKLAPNTRPVIKKRPRGKPFAKANNFGEASRWKPGQSGNPTGRPKQKEVSKALRARLAEVAVGDRLGRTNAELLADQWIRVGLSGNIAALISLTDRTEGKPAVTVGVNGEPVELRVLIDAVEQVSEKLGAPEGFIAARPRLKAVDVIEGEVVAEGSDAS